MVDALLRWMRRTQSCVSNLITSLGSGRLQAGASSRTHEYSVAALAVPPKSPFHLRSAADHADMVKRSPSVRPFGQSSARTRSASSGFSSRQLSFRMVLCCAAALGLALTLRNCDGVGDIGWETAAAVGVATRESAATIASASATQSRQELLGR